MENFKKSFFKVLELNHVCKRKISEDKILIFKKIDKRKLEVYFQLRKKQKDTNNYSKLKLPNNYKRFMGA